MDNNAQRIEIGGVGVVPSKENLRGHVYRSSAGLVPEMRVVIAHLVLGDPEISEPGIAIFLKNYVLRLKVLVDNFHLVDVLERDQDAGGYELFIGGNVLISF